MCVYVCVLGSEDERVRDKGTLCCARRQEKRDGEEGERERGEREREAWSSTQRTPRVGCPRSCGVAFILDSTVSTVKRSHGIFDVLEECFPAVFLPAHCVLVRTLEQMLLSVFKLSLSPGLG